MLGEVPLTFKGEGLFTFDISDDSFIGCLIGQSGGFCKKEKAEGKESYF